MKKVNVSFFINKAFFLQAMLQPLHPASSSRQNTVSKGDHGKGERFHRGEGSSQVKNATEDGSECQSLPKLTETDRSHRRQANSEHALPNPESPEAVLLPKPMQSPRAQSMQSPRAQISRAQSPRVQSQAQKCWKEILSSPSSSQEGLLQDTPQITHAEIHSPAPLPVERKETLHIQEEDELEEEELQELLSKLMDAFTLEMPAGKIFS